MKLGYSLSPVWLVARRELRDQFRDWRILFPLIVLTLIFPLLMNQVAKGAVEFINQYGGNLIVDRLVPFSVLIIGFFPNTVSLVIALESFVGEKERGTVEPLLCSPLQDWHIYLAKLLVGIITPLFSSFTAITFYLIIVSRQQITMPEPHTLAQLFLLTAAHAFLMVSGAIVVSAQSTSVRAANLLSSFIIIPVAFLMQGESILLFWGDAQVLWLAVLGVVILAGLLIRVGLVHFQREYLLGREIDIINLRWIWQTFWAAFSGGAHSIPDWYHREIGRTLRHLRVPLAIMLALAVVGVLFAYAWFYAGLAQAFVGVTPEQIAEVTAEAEMSQAFTCREVRVSAFFILGHNLRAMGAILAAGLISFSVLGVLLFLVNMGFFGAVLAFFQLLGYSIWPLVFAGLLPHGIFEIPAMVLAGAAVLRLGARLVTPQTGKSMGEVAIGLLADWARVTIGLILPLLSIAAVIEAYVTPKLLCAVLM